MAHSTVVLCFNSCNNIKCNFNSQKAIKYLYSWPGTLLYPHNFYIPSGTGLQVGMSLERVFLLHLCAQMGGTNWDLTKMGDREGLQNSVCSQGQRDH